MAGVRLILRYQWKAYWRRFSRAGQLPQFDIILLLLLGALFIFRLPPVLMRAVRELEAGRTAVMDQLLFVTFAAWLYPRIEDTLISLNPKNLFRFPLSTDSLLLIRIGSFFISPLAMFITAGSLASASALLVSPRPFFGIVAAIPCFVTAAGLGLSLSHFLRSAVLRRRLIIAAAVIILPLGAVLFTIGKDAALRMGGLISFTPARLVTMAAVAPDYWTALISIAALVGCAALALLLLRWSFQRSLADQEVIRPPAKRASSLIRFPGRLGGVVRKEQSYFRKLPSPWIGLLLTLAFSQIFWLGAPPPVSFQIIILILFTLNTGMSANSFGLDEPAEINRYLLFPLSGRDVLLGKNLGYAVIAAVQLSVMLPLAFWRLGWREVSFGLIEAAVLALAHLAWGNLSSLLEPFKMRFYRMENGGSIIAGLACLVFCSLPGAVIIYLTRFNSNLLAAKVGAILSLIALAYLGSLHFAGRKFERDWQKLSARLL